MNIETYIRNAQKKLRSASWQPTSQNSRRSVQSTHVRLRSMGCLPGGAFGITAFLWRLGASSDGSSRKAQHHGQSWLAKGRGLISVVLNDTLSPKLWHDKPANPKNETWMQALCLKDLTCQALNLTVYRNFRATSPKTEMPYTLKKDVALRALNVQCQTLNTKRELRCGKPKPSGGKS